MIRHYSCFAAVLLLLALAPGRAAEAAAGVDKSGYSLVRPTPDGQLRELSTDRPDTTESPFTIDAGHVQLEMDFVNATRDRTDGVKTTGWGVAPFNIRVGVLNDFELGVFIAPWSRVTSTSRGGPSERVQGFGDVTVRAKYNFWGNDGGASAFGLIADLTLPTARGGLGVERTEGALILPVSFELADGWELGAMTGAEFHARDTGGYRAAWINTITVGHDLTKTVGAYVELTSSTGDGPHIATLDAGLTWKLNASTQLDAGFLVGVSRRADDLTVFTGLSRRF